MNHRPQDQGPGAGRDAAQGGARHRTNSDPGGDREATYSDAARYLDSAWESSSTGVPPTPYDGPTQVVPVHQVPMGHQPPEPQPPGPRAANAQSPGGAQPPGMQAAGAQAAGMQQPGVPQPGDRHPGAQPLGAQPHAAQPGGPEAPAPASPELDLGAYAMGAPQYPGHGTGPNPGHDAAGHAHNSPGTPDDHPPAGHGGDDGHGGYGDYGGYGGHEDPHDDGSGSDPGSGSGVRRGKRRRAVVIWSVVGAVALTGAGLVAAKTLTGDDKPDTTSVGLTTSPTPSSAAPTSAPPPTSTAPPSSKAPSIGASSGRPSGSASSGSKSPSGSPSGSASTGSKSPKTDANGDGIADDPGATNPAKLVGGARTAYQQAKAAMAADGITMTLTSGKRSYEHQKDLWEKEVRDLGSVEAARMRVLPPDESSHVDGNAIDINVAAQPWMKSKGKTYGWCQIYANEPWHFEYQASYKTQGCPTMKPHP
ncbi:D-alanyl-D-alanine carboxypeptidase family protein [Yinghuangia sp. YIM S09857]|uniref:D-alanyl-D-alanine carboxypeptidase family protein n=1 Tax=Yinghuangia sp. YIM S09857 TaxID=3436929 RepID=UPI003F537995